MGLYCPECGALQDRPNSEELVCSSCGYSAKVTYWLWLPKEEFLKQWKKKHGEPIPNWVKE